MEHENGGDGQWDSSHAHDRVMAPCPQNTAQNGEEQGIEDGEDDEKDSPTVELVIIPPIMAIGAEESHVEMAEMYLFNYGSISTPLTTVAVHIG
ncbi:MAG: hypothetical protein Q9219_003727, partial [cf. Caloplaca sp. 3 TL-2023]